MFAVGGVVDHVHMLAGMPATISIAEFIQKVKANSSRWMHEQSGRRFEWQPGYGAFSIGISQVNATCRYIRNQEAHHRKLTFDEEIERILARHGLLAGAMAGL